MLRATRWLWWSSTIHPQWQNCHKLLIVQSEFEFLVGGIGGRSHLSIVPGAHSKHSAVFFVKPPQILGGQIPKALSSICRNHRKIVLICAKNLIDFAKIPQRPDPLEQTAKYCENIAHIRVSLNRKYLYIKERNKNWSKTKTSRGRK